MRTPHIEIHVPISPNEHFFTMVHYLAASLRRLGPPTSEVTVVVSVGDDCEPFDLQARNPWSRRYPLRWTWVARELFRYRGYYATATERFRADFRAPLVLMLDADILVLRDLSSLMASVRESGAVHGLVAHVSPFWIENRARSGSARSNAGWWEMLFRAARLDPPRLECQHTGWRVAFGDEEYRYCPPYFNFGVVMGPAEAMSRIGAVIYRDLDAVDAVLETVFKCQLALCLALSRLRLPWRELSMRDNFPNRDSFVKGFPSEARELRILHYLGSEDPGFRKVRDMADIHAVRGFLGRDGLGPANTLLRQALAALQPIVEADSAGSTST